MLYLLYPNHISYSKLV